MPPKQKKRPSTVVRFRNSNFDKARDIEQRADEHKPMWGKGERCDLLRITPERYEKQFKALTERGYSVLEANHLIVRKSSELRVDAVIGHTNLLINKKKFNRRLLVSSGACSSGAANILGLRLYLLRLRKIGFDDVAIGFMNNKSGGGINLALVIHYEQPIRQLLKNVKPKGDSLELLDKLASCFSKKGPNGRNIFEQLVCLLCKDTDIKLPHLFDESSFKQDMDQYCKLVNEGELADEVDEFADEVDDLADEGDDLIDEGDDLIDEGDDLVDEGDDLEDEGDDLADEGNDLANAGVAALLTAAELHLQQQVASSVSDQLLPLAPQYYPQQSVSSADFMQQQQAIACAQIVAQWGLLIRSLQLRKTIAEQNRLVMEEQLAAMIQHQRDIEQQQQLAIEEQQRWIREQPQGAIEQLWQLVIKQRQQLDIEQQQLTIDQHQQRDIEYLLRVRAQQQLFRAASLQMGTHRATFWRSNLASQAPQQGTNPSDNLGKRTREENGAVVQPGVSSSQDRKKARIYQVENQEEKHPEEDSSGFARQP